jgi:hypothetical protein
MLHPHTELRHVDDVIGYGVFATHRIPKGTITWVRDDLDQTFKPDELSQFAPAFQQLLDKYTFLDRLGNAVLCWDLARYINHSCEANCLAAGYEFEVAIRDIELGEELTDEYGSLNLQDSFTCFCGKSHCRKLIHPNDLARFWKKWDEQLQTAFGRIHSVVQPLRSYMKNTTELDEAAQDPRKMRSCRFNYYPSVYTESAPATGELALVEQARPRAAV